MKKVEGYFDFRFTPDNKYTTGRKIRIEVTIKDEGFVENLQMIFYHLDKVVKKQTFNTQKKFKRIVFLKLITQKGQARCLSLLNLSKTSKKTTKLLNFYSWKIMEKEV